MKITTRYITPASTRKRRLQKPDAPKITLKYFRKREYLIATVFFSFIMLALYSFFKTQRQVENITDLGIVQSVSRPEWTSGSVTVMTNSRRFEARPFFNIKDGQHLKLYRYISGDVVLCIDGQQSCIKLTKQDTQKIISTH